MFRAPSKCTTTTRLAKLDAHIVNKTIPPVFPLISENGYFFLKLHLF